MQSDHVLKKLNFNLLAPLPFFFVLGGGGVAAGKIFATIYMLLHS